jgi:ABC-type multidrug transport system fused ATPase/permease subunit
MAYFDSKDSGSPSIKVTTNGNTINNGISDKLSSAFVSLSTFFTAFIVAFAVQWKLTLITIGIVPVILLANTLCFAFDGPIEVRVSAAYNKAGLLAEEIFSTITTVHAFWLHPYMAKRYDSYLAVSLDLFPSTQQLLTFIPGGRTSCNEKVPILWRPILNTVLLCLCRLCTCFLARHSHVEFRGNY